MNSIFLRAKHWQIFVPFMIIPFIAMIVFSIIVAVLMVSNTPENPEDGVWVAYFMPFLFAISGFVQFSWFWNVLTKLSTLIPAEKVNMPVKRIKLFFLIPIIYICLIPLFVAFVITNIANQDPAGIMKVAIAGFFVFILHLFCIFCMFHTIYFAAKTIRAAELQRNVTFSDFTGDFFLIWFFPVGIWFIQPRINKLIEQSNDSFISIREELLD